MNPGSNSRKAFVPRPKMCQLDWAYTFVEGITVDVVEYESYRRVTLSKKEAEILLRGIGLKCTLGDRLAALGVKLIRGKKIHAYYTKIGAGITAGGESSGVGLHSDPQATVLVHLCGTKMLKLGGIHNPGNGTTGNTVVVGKGVQARLMCVKLEPNFVVGFAKRQVHQLECPTGSKNLSLSFQVVSVE